MEDLQYMRERLEPERYTELAALVHEQGDTPECIGFIQFLSNIEHPLQGIHNNDELLGLFERYKQWMRLREILSQLNNDVTTRLHIHKGRYFQALISAIDEKWTREFSEAYHSSRLNNEELTQLIAALQVIGTMLRLNSQDMAPCLYLLNNTKFDEHILVRGNPILDALLEPLQNSMEGESPSWLDRLNHDDEFRMNQLARIERHLRELQGTGTVLDIVDTRIPVIPPGAAHHVLAVTQDECPITLEKLSSLPVHERAILTCGHMFKKSAIKKSLKDMKGLCPVCKQHAVINPAYKGTTSSVTHIPPGGIASSLVERQIQKGKAFSEAVVLNCGHVFERSEIKKRDTCPKCSAKITKITKIGGGSRKCKKNSRRKSKKIIKRKKTIKRR